MNNEVKYLKPHRHCNFWGQITNIYGAKLQKPIKTIHIRRKIYNTVRSSDPACHTVPCPMPTELEWWTGWSHLFAHCNQICDIKAALNLHIDFKT